MVPIAARGVARFTFNDLCVAVSNLGHARVYYLYGRFVLFPRPFLCLPTQLSSASFCCDYRVISSFVRFMFVFFFCLFFFDTFLFFPGTQAVGPADYIALASTFHTLVLDHIPRLHAHRNRNEVRRFINLIDELYNYKVKMICSSEVPLNELIEVEQGGQESEEKFMFGRVVSRLTEMQSEQYLQTAHHRQHQQEESEEVPK